MAMDVVLDKVSMQFGERVALRDVDIAIAAGEVVSFVGPPGCGKTTVLRLIAGLNEPTSGSVRIGGRDMAGVGPSERPIGLVLHSLPVFPLMKVWENVVFHLDNAVLDRRQRRARGEALLALFDLDSQVDKALIELGRLDRLRVAMASVLADDPQVILLDEPFAALPPEFAGPLLGTLRVLRERTGLTLAYVTHDGAAARSLGGRIAWMSEGRVERLEVVTEA